WSMRSTTFPPSVRQDTAAHLEPVEVSSVSRLLSWSGVAGESDGSERRVGARFDTQFGQNRTHVVDHRPFRQHQLDTDLRVAEPAGEEPQDFGLAWRQECRVSTGRGAGAARNTLDSTCAKAALGALGHWPGT